VALADKQAGAVITAYLVAQIDAARRLRLFDRLGRSLGPDDYREYVLPYSQAILQAVHKTDVPSIHFGTDTATLLPLLKEAGGDVIGLDWRVELDRGWETVGFDRAVQGNLDPAALFAPRDELERRVRRILSGCGARAISSISDMVSCQRRPSKT
jgi:uroporphyrinogen decarboxylase